MLKLNLKTIVEDAPLLNKILEINLPIKTAYWLKRLNDELEKENKLFKKERDEIIKELGELKDQEQDIYQVKKENLSAFKEKIDEIGAREIEFDFEPIDINILIENNIQIASKDIPTWLFKE